MHNYAEVPAIAPGSRKVKSGGALLRTETAITSMIQKNLLKPKDFIVFLRARDTPLGLLAFHPFLLGTINVSFGGSGRLC